MHMGWIWHLNSYSAHVSYVYTVSYISMGWIWLFIYLYLSALKDMVADSQAISLKVEYHDIFYV